MFFWVMLLCISSIISHAETDSSTEREIRLDQHFEEFEKGEQKFSYRIISSLKGEGHFVVLSYYAEYDKSKEGSTIALYSYVFSDKRITGTWKQNPRAGVEDEHKISTYLYNDVYYYKAYNMAVFCPSTRTMFYSGFPNIKTMPSIDDIPTPEDIIDSGTLDLTRDSYLTDDEKAAVYNRDLDFLTLKGDYKVKYTIEKDGNGKWNFITPDEAGILFEWTNRKDIDGAYVKITAYGEFYEGFWASTYTNTGITVSDIRRNDLSYLLMQKDMVSIAQSNLGKPSGFGFVVKYMYIQSFGTIDGQFCRGRIYKLDSDLVTDYGNAGSEYDEYFPEITDGDSMPPEYEPDPDDPDPEKTEPDPDPDDDTTIITPVPKPDDPIFDSDLDLLKALSVFFDGLKSSMVLLGNFPAFIANIFGFLPSSVISLIGLSIVAVIILRFIGR